MKQMPNLWLQTLTTFDATLSQIEVCLDILKENAESADFFDIAIKNQYNSDIVYMKQFFERAESLVRSSNVE